MSLPLPAIGRRITAIRVEFNLGLVIYKVQPLIITNDLFLARRTIQSDIRKRRFKIFDTKSHSKLQIIMTRGGGVLDYYFLYYQPVFALAFKIRSSDNTVEGVIPLNSQSSLISYIGEECHITTDFSIPRGPFNPSVLLGVPEEPRRVKSYLGRNGLSYFCAFEGYRRIDVIDLPVTLSPVMDLLEWRKSVISTSHRLEVQRKAAIRVSVGV